LSSGFPTERPITVFGFPGQPFQHSNYRFGVLVLCLLPGQFGLESGMNLSGFNVTNGQRFSANEQSFFIGGSNQGVVDTKVDSNGDDFFRFGSFKGNAEESLATSDAEAVDAFGSLKVFLEMVGNFPANLLPPLKRRDGQTAISTKREILSMQKERCWFAENKRTRGWLAIGLGSGINGSSCSDGIASHLGSQGGLCWVIDFVVQFQGSKRFAIIKTNRTNRLLIPIEFNNGFVNKAIFIKDYRYGSLNVHTDNIFIQPKKSRVILKIIFKETAIPLPAKAGSLLAENL
jgi:hypothetical protein